MDYRWKSSPFSPSEHTKSLFLLDSKESLNKTIFLMTLTIILYLSETRDSPLHVCIILLLHQMQKKILIMTSSFRTYCVPCIQWDSSIISSFLSPPGTGSKQSCLLLLHFSFFSVSPRGYGLCKIFVCFTEPPAQLHHYCYLTIPYIAKGHGQLKTICGSLTMCQAWCKHVSSSVSNGL